MNHYDRGLMWFRRDLRADDNAALHHALMSCKQLWCVFVFDTDILDPLLERGISSDRRVDFILASLDDLDADLRSLGENQGAKKAGLIVRHGQATEILPDIAETLQVQAVFANHDDEPSAQERDSRILGALAHRGIMFHGFKDHVIFERREVLTKAEQPFTVFTPYKNAWLKKLEAIDLEAWPIVRLAGALAPVPSPWDTGKPTLKSLGFEPSNLAKLKLPTGATGAQDLLLDFAHRIEHYSSARNFPALKGPSYLGVHLRFGTVSVRQLARLSYPMHLDGNEGASVWLSELIWRDFYHQILSNFPHVVGSAFKPEYDNIKFEHGKHAKVLFTAWCEGRTGFPLVDAAMAQLNQTGYMHNRLRMVSASFLTKDLGIDWRWGEQYFADHLIDFDLASNNGGWQWASSSGCDAQPFFRIFNPMLQSRRFDPDGKFIRRYVPQIAGLPNAVLHAPWEANEIELEAANVILGGNYPKPIVDHAQARERTLLRYAVVKQKSRS